MKENFMSMVKSTYIESEDTNISTTENGALGYRTSGKNLLDMNFKISSYRNMSPADIIADWNKAYYDDKLTALRFLFFLGDIRGGLGERRTFRTIFTHIGMTNPKLACNLLGLVPEYTRWDYVLDLLDNKEVRPAIIKLINEQLTSDLVNMEAKKPISLLAKWLPSINSKNKEVRQLALSIYKDLGFPSEKDYRKGISALRRYVDVVEIKMCSNEWSEINYATVPSKANVRYSKAFIKHDEERRTAYFDALKSGETKINASTLFPYEIVSKCKNAITVSGNWIRGERSYTVDKERVDQTMIELWKALPDFVKGNNNTICVADGSGSMTWGLSRTNVTALDVANSLAIYFSERCSGEFKDNYITFSENPQLVDMSQCNDIYEKLAVAYGHNECTNTDVYKVFKLILDTAVANNLSQEDMVDNILILSDMEFDSATNVYSASDSHKPSKRLFKQIEEEYAAKGYKLPRLVFWNICGRTNTIPVVMNSLGVALVSGFSPVIAKMVLSNKLDPYEVLLDQLMTERYDAVEEAAKDFI